jgi:hypothetical protein
MSSADRAKTSEAMAHHSPVRLCAAPNVGDCLGVPRFRFEVGWWSQTRTRLPTSDFRLFSIRRPPNCRKWNIRYRSARRGLSGQRARWDLSMKWRFLFQVAAEIVATWWWWMVSIAVCESTSALSKNGMHAPWTRDEGCGTGIRY